MAAEVGTGCLYTLELADGTVVHGALKHEGLRPPSPSPPPSPPDGGYGYGYGYGTRRLAGVGPFTTAPRSLFPGGRKARV